MTLRGTGRRAKQGGADNASETYGEKLALTLGAKLGEKIGFLFAEHKEEIMRQPVPKFDPLE